MKCAYCGKKINTCTGLLRLNDREGLHFDCSAIAFRELENLKKENDELKRAMEERRSD